MKYKNILGIAFLDTYVNVEERRKKKIMYQNGASTGTPTFWHETDHRESVDLFPKVWPGDIPFQHSLGAKLGGTFAVVTGNDLLGFEPVVER